MIGSSLLISVVASAQADVVRNDVATPIADRSVEKAPQAPPQVPYAFDQETVQRMLDFIDQPYNASILKVMYFQRRLQSGLPVEEGFRLLSAAVEKEAVGTKRWFLLRNVQGYAAFRVDRALVEDGYRAYDTIFDHAEDAPHANAIYTLKQTIHEFVSSVPGKLNDLGLSGRKETQETLESAWRAYSVILRTSAGTTSPAMEPPWIPALNKAGVQDAFKPLVKDTLKDSTIVKSFNLLWTDASLLSATDPVDSIDLLQQAKPLLPRSRDGKLEMNRAKPFYEILVRLLEIEGRTSEARDTLKERIRLTATGYAILLLADKKDKDEDAVKEVLSTLSSSNAPELEVNEAAQALFTLSKDSEHPDPNAMRQAEELLKQYLTTQRSRNPEEELYARFLLANQYVRELRWDEARSVLNTSNLKGPLSPKAQIRLHMAESMLAEVGQRIETNLENLQ